MEERGFISKEQILEYVSERDIFELVFGFKPEEYQYTTSPFRQDEGAGCWFEYYKDKLRFVDFGNSEVRQGIKMSDIDCFDAVQVYFNIPNFYLTLDFIKKKLIDGKGLNIRKKEKPKTQKKKKVEMQFQSDFFKEKDRRYWSKYGISKANLIEDGVFSVKSYKLHNTKSGDLYFDVRNDLCYAYTKFYDYNGSLIPNVKKIYRPLQKGRRKFAATTDENTIGSIETLKGQDILIISKSYKDCRVLRNFGFDSVWFQNEGMIPHSRALTHLTMKYKEIIVFYDNDETGIMAAQKLVKAINRFFPDRARSVILPINYLVDYNVKDPSDMYFRMGKSHLESFLKEKIINYRKP